jgi:Holliday junction DNA helicase RuvB
MQERSDQFNFTLIVQLQDRVSYSPMRARFGISSRLQYYTTELLTTIVERSAGILKMPISYEAALEIAAEGVGERLVLQMRYCRVRDFAQIKGNGTIDIEIAIRS